MAEPPNTAEPGPNVAAVTVQLPPECCMTCKFYALEAGVCRIRSPAVLLISPARGKEGAQWVSAFPPMRPNGWCGEWRKGA